MPADSTAQRVATAARKLLDEAGADAVSMRRVAEAANITAMAVYRHYPNRAGLLNALADQGFAELAVRLNSVRQTGDLEARLRKLLSIYLDHALAHPRLFELMFLNQREGARQFPQDFVAGHSPTANPMMRLIQEGMTSGLFRQDDVSEIVFEMGALLQGLVMLFLGGRMAMSPTQFRAFCRRSFQRYMYGIRS